MLVYLQGIIGCLTVTCIFIGFKRLPVGDAATIIFCSPIFVMIFSHVILREHCGFFRVFVIALLMVSMSNFESFSTYLHSDFSPLQVGVVLIAKPPFLKKLLNPQSNSQVIDGGGEGSHYSITH